MKYFPIVLSILGMAACVDSSSSSPSPELPAKPSGAPSVPGWPSRPTPGAPTGPRSPLATFHGHVSPAHGTVTIDSVTTTAHLRGVRHDVRADDGAGKLALDVIDAFFDDGTDTYGHHCGAAMGQFVVCTHVALVNQHLAGNITGIFATIDATSPAAGIDADITDGYGDLGVGVLSSSSGVLWTFTLPDSSDFTFDGHLSGTVAWASSAGAHAGLPRTEHTATLLPTGQVLVTGGMGADGPLASTEIYDAGSDRWSGTVPLGTARAQHTATLVDGGAGPNAVLVAGGTDGFGALASTEIYNGIEWLPAADMANARTAHTATALDDGQLVIVAGGLDAMGVEQNTVEIYIPALGNWFPLAPMGTARISHTATLLADGNSVLVTGGANAAGDDVLASAEIYNRATQTWTRAAPMGTPRVGHTATLLSSGLVLVAGGDDGTQALASAELYDPARDTWTPVVPMATSHEQHTATLLADGTVLVAGGATGCGCDVTGTAEIFDGSTWLPAASLHAARADQTATPLSDGRVLVTGGDNNDGIVSATTVYDPGVDRWSDDGGMVVPRVEHTATTLPNGQVLVVGGVGAANVPLADAELYNPATGTWASTGSLTTGRTGHTATLLSDGTVLVVGGNVAGGGTSQGAELYDPAAKTWSDAGTLTDGRAFHTATLLANGQVLVAGGFDASTEALQSAELYDPGTRTWTPTGSLTDGRVYHTATALPDGRVVVAGGLFASATTSFSLDSVEIYDPMIGAWTGAAPMASARDAHAAVLLDADVVVIGGLQSSSGGFGGPLADVEIYDPRADTWLALPPLSEPRFGHTATALPDGQIFTTGGFTDFTTEVFDPAVPFFWGTTGSLAIPRFEHAAALLANGQVLVSGGFAAFGGDLLGTSELYDP